MPAFWKAALAAPFLLSAELPPNSTYCSDGMPPLRFQQPATAVLMLVPENRIDELCGKAPPGRQTIACTREINGTPVMIMPAACPYAYTGDWYAKIICHEAGHVNGWPASHGD